MDIEMLQTICLSLPAATEEIKWENNLCFSVGGKMFCITDLEGNTGLSFKVPDEDFETLCNREGFMPAPYLARARWVKLNADSKISRKELESFLAKSYQLVAAKLSKKLKAELGLHF